MRADLGRERLAGTTCRFSTIDFVVPPVGSSSTLSAGFRLSNSISSMLGFAERSVHAHDLHGDRQIALVVDVGDGEVHRTDDVLRALHLLPHGLEGLRALVVLHEPHRGALLGGAAEIDFALGEQRNGGEEREEETEECR